RRRSWRTALNAPLTLNAPARWKLSGLRRSRESRSVVSSGVLRTCGPIRSAAAAISAACTSTYESGTDPRLPDVGAEGERDGPLVVDADHHPGAKAAGAGRDAALGQSVCEALAQLASAVRRSGAREAGPAAAGGVGVQRELRHDQGLAAHVL